MRCKSCGNEIKSDYKFCPFCAARLTQDFEDHFGELEPAVYSAQENEPVLYGEGRELPPDPREWGEDSRVRRAPDPYPEPDYREPRRRPDRLPEQGAMPAEYRPQEPGPRGYEPERYREPPVRGMPPSADMEPYRERAPRPAPEPPQDAYRGPAQYRAREPYGEQAYRGPDPYRGHGMPPDPYREPEQYQTQERYSAPDPGREPEPRREPVTFEEPEDCGIPPAPPRGPYTPREEARPPRREAPGACAGKPERPAYTVYRPGKRLEPAQQPAASPAPPEEPAKPQKDRRGNPYHHGNWDEGEETEEVPNLITFEVPEQPEVLPEPADVPRPVHESLEMDEGRVSTAPYVSMKPEVAAEPRTAEEGGAGQGPGPVFKALLILFVVMAGFLAALAVYWLTVVRVAEPVNGGDPGTSSYEEEMPPAEETPEAE